MFIAYALTISIKDSWWPWLNVITFILRILPSYAFCDGMFNLSIKGIWKIIADDDSLGPFSARIAGADIIMLAITGFVFLFGLIFIEKLLLTSFFSKLTTPKDIEEQINDQDSDVEAEEKRVMENFGDEKYIVQVKKLRKIFKQKGKPKVAVNKVSFGIQ